MYAYMYTNEKNNEGHAVMKALLGVVNEINIAVVFLEAKIVEKKKITILLT